MTVLKQKRKKYQMKILYNFGHSVIYVGMSSIIVNISSFETLN